MTTNIYDHYSVIDIAKARNITCFEVRRTIAGVPPVELTAEERLELKRWAEIRELTHKKIARAWKTSTAQVKLALLGHMPKQPSQPKEPEEPKRFKRHNITPEERLFIVNSLWFDPGTSNIARLAKQFGLSQAAIRLLRPLHYKPRPKQGTRTQEEWDKILAELARENNISYIARKYNLARTSIYAQIKKQKVQSTEAHDASAS